MFVCEAIIADYFYLLTAKLKLQHIGLQFNLQLTLVEFSVSLLCAQPSRARRFNALKTIIVPTSCKVQLTVTLYYYFCMQRLIDRLGLPQRAATLPFWGRRRWRRHAKKTSASN